MDKVYLETSLVSYLVARRSRDLILAGRQQITLDWWEQQRQKFDLYVSELVLLEAQAGDTTEVAKRLTALTDLPVLDIPTEASRLASLLLSRGVVPPKANADAIHIAVATVHGMDFLLTWNLKHIANAQVRKLAARIFRAEGYESPEICTPEELGDLV
jgi:hypothetical protein